MIPLQYQGIVKAALTEDLSQGDITSGAIVNEGQSSVATITAKQPGVIAGIPVVEEVFRMVDPSLNFVPFLKDGAAVVPGQDIAEVKGPTASLLSGERTALNFLQRLSGVATVTSLAVAEAAGFKTQILDTRKTTPGLRQLEKYAVLMGGGRNHRYCLGDAVMIKDNHIAAAGSITEAVRRVRSRIGLTVKVEVETEDLTQVQEAIDSKADIIMLDNMSLELMAQAVVLIDGQALTEASGGIRLEMIKEVAATGVDYLSLGWLTHSAQALDISLNIID